MKKKTFFKTIGIIAGICFGIYDHIRATRMREYIQDWILDNREDWDNICLDSELKRRVNSWSFNSQATKYAYAIIRALEASKRGS